ncbi:MAG TPA: hypothetical protein VI341_11245 [Actinomycetota bacterium]
MRRALVTVITTVLLVSVFAGPAGARSDLVTTTGPMPLVQGAVIDGACPFPVIWTDRGGRTLTTWARGKDIVMQRITGSSQVVLENGASGLALTFDIKETSTIVYDLRRGSATTVQIGSSGLFFDPGTISGAPSFTWYGGVAATSGRLDQKTWLYDDVEWQRHAGLEGDVCDMLVSGLKTRH